jgi:hypothetical protein
VQLREMRASIDDLRSDVAALRRAVLEWPELERMANDVSALRAASNDVLEILARVPASPSPATPAASVDVDALQEELADLRTEMVALRRRISLRAEGTTLGPEELSAIAEAVTERLLRSFRPAQQMPG